MTAHAPINAPDPDLFVMVAKGWTPPAEAVEPWRHLIRPFYDARGWQSLAVSRLDPIDVQTILALIAMLQHFNLPIPSAPEPAANDDV